MAKRKKTAVQRERDRVNLLRVKLEAEQLRAMLSYYPAADRKTRRNKDWKAQSLSADATLLPDQATLIARSRHTVATTWIGKAARRAQVRNVAGRGIMVVPVARDREGNELTELNKVVASRYMRWASSVKCDVERRRTFWQYQRLAVAEEFIAGEAIFVWSYRPGYGYRVQSVEPDQLDTTIQSFNENEVRGGVEIDADGATVAYHIFERHPNDYLISHRRKPRRIPADQVYHFFDAERALQTQGEPKLAPVLTKVRNFESYDDATLWRARMEACIGAAVKRNQPGILGSPLTLPRESSDTGTTASGLRTTDFVPGMVANLQPGEDITFNTPTSPGNMYEPFTTVTLRGIGAGVGQSYGALTRHNDANFSAARQDMLEDAREIEPVQDMLIDQLIMPSYEQWYRFEATEGNFPLDFAEFMQEPERFLEAEYIPPARYWIDPEKEVNAFEKALKLRIVTRKEIVAQRGGRFTELLRQVESERREAESLEIVFPEDQEQQSAQAQAEAAKNPPPAPAQLAAIDAPNYRVANMADESCRTCKNFVDGMCHAYDFAATPASVCDAWENDGVGKSFPPGPQDGTRGIDRDFQAAAVAVAPT